MSDSSNPDGRGPLDGITVIDLTQVLAGPFCTKMLYEFGADILKIEPPGWGDITRLFAPFLDDGRSGFFEGLNFGKRSAVLNLKDLEDLRVLKEHIKRADVIIENFRPGVMGRLGLGSDVLRELNPNIIITHISGRGQDSDVGEYDATSQAISGMAASNSEEGEPRIDGIMIGDEFTGVIAAVNTLVALVKQAKTGKGSEIDVSMLESMLILQGAQAGMWTALGEKVFPNGKDNVAVSPFGFFKTGDGNIAIACLQPQFEKLCEALELPELSSDPRFLQNDDRMENNALLREKIEAALASKPTEEWIEIFQQHKVPSAPVNTIEEALELPEVTARQALISIEGQEKMKVVANTALGMTDRDIIHPPAPTLGEHTEEIRQEARTKPDNKPQGTIMRVLEAITGVQIKLGTKMLKRSLAEKLKNLAQKLER